MMVDIFVYKYSTQGIFYQFQKYRPMIGLKLSITQLRVITISPKSFLIR